MGATGGRGQSVSRLGLARVGWRRRVGWARWGGAVDVGRCV